MSSKVAIILGLLIVTEFFACDNETAKIPKQRMYPFIQFPTKKDTSYNSPECGFSFPHPTYFSYKKDSLFFGDKPVNDCWFDLHSSALNATIYCSYYPVINRKGLDSLIRDAFELTNKHNIKANARRESVIQNEDGLSGLMFEVEGPVATPIQFFLTDSTRHFFRAAVYFDAKVNPDSTAPVLNFIKSDVEKMISGFKWKK
jgi:gliding motility-associated lipoprotein GldD